MSRLLTFLSVLPACFKLAWTVARVADGIRGPDAYKAFAMIAWEQAFDVEFRPMTEAEETAGFAIRDLA